MALDPRPRRRSAHPPNQNGVEARTTPGTVGVACAKCGTAIPSQLKFCPACGTKAPPAPAPQDFEGIQTRVGPRQPPAAAQKPGRSTLFFGGALQAARAKLTLIRGDGEDGVSFTLAGTDHLAGRGECPISFPDDPFLSPTHANFRYFNNQLIVRDEGSLNGVFVRITDTVDGRERHDDPRRRAGARRPCRARSPTSSRRRRHVLLGEHDASRRD